MRIYDYLCEECGYTAEELFQAKDLALKNIVCPKCGSLKYTKQISKPNIGTVEPTFGAVINGEVIPGSFEK